MTDNNGMTRRERRHTVIAVSIFVMAAAGAVFALYTFLPKFFADPNAKHSVLGFTIVLVVAFVLIAIVARLSRKERRR